MPGDKCEAPVSRLGGVDDQLFLLSLDGGGVRGLSSLMILKQLMEAIDPRQPPKPCDYFDMIGGTSTGGLIAIMLGRMRLTVDECILAYNELAPKVFTKVHHRINLRNGETQGRFDHVALENEIKALLKRHGMDSEALLRESDEASPCKVFVCATSRQTGRPVVFSSYHNPRRSNDRLSTAKIWEAARATSAATTFFDPITIGEETFVDGATGANNPINYLWSEAGDVWGEGDGLDEGRVECLVSIGTGAPPLVPFGPDVAGVAKALKAISTDTEVTASVFQKHHSKLFTNGNAFRFNVVVGLESVSLHEVEKWEDIAAATRAFIQEQDTFVKLKRCAMALQERQWTGQRLDALFRDINDFARPSMEYLNDPNNHIGSEDLQWLTHTSVYELWRSPAAPSPVLYCRPAPDAPICVRESLAASVAQVLPNSNGSRSRKLSGPRGQPAVLCRSLYFQCLRKQSGGVRSSGDANGPPVSVHHVLVSLICQALLMDHSVPENLAHRIRILAPGHMRAIKSATSNPESEPLLTLTEMLVRVVSTGTRPDSIAIDNVHLLPVRGRNDLYDCLRFIFLKTHQPLKQSIPVILSGQHSDDVTPELRVWGFLQVDSAMEYRECLGSLYFREWKTRQDQIDSPNEGTNEWVWKHTEYEAWDAAHSGILWIEGKPGSGKSVLARSMQRRIVASWQRNATDLTTPGHSRPRGSTTTSIVVGWFYSTRLGDAGTSHYALLRSLIYQLLVQEPSFFHDIVADYYRKFPAPIQPTQPHEGGFRVNVSTPWVPGPSLEGPRPDATRWCESTDFEAVAREILERVAATGTSMVCIVDAMDEAKASTEVMLRSATSGRSSKTLTILGALARLVIGVEASRMKFILLSRPEPLIELDFLRAQRKLDCTFRITLEDENRGDIEVLVDHGIAALQAAIHTYDSDSDIDVHCRKEKATGRDRGLRGMHRDLQKLQVSEADALKRIREYLSSMPKGLSSGSRSL